MRAPLESRDGGNMRRDTCGANRLVHIHPRHLGPELRSRKDQSHRQLVGQRQDALHRPPLRSSGDLRTEPVQCREREGAVQRPGVEMRPPQPLGNERGCGRLAGRRRTVNRDDAHRARSPAAYERIPGS